MRQLLAREMLRVCFTLRSSIYIGVDAAGPIDMHAANDLPIERPE